MLEALDVLNEQLIGAGKRPVTFEHDCREGICGSCGFLVNGQAHGPQRATTVCQLYLRQFKDGDTLVLDPWRAKAFPPDPGPGGGSRQLGFPDWCGGLLLGEHRQCPRGQWDLDRQRPGGLSV